MDPLSFDEIIHYALDAMPNCVIVDVHMNVAYINEIYTRLLGVDSPDVMIGKPVTDYLPNTLLADIIETGQERIGDIFIATNLKTGEEIPLITNKFPIFHKGEVIGAIGMSLPHGISDKIRPDDELKFLRKRVEYYKQYFKERSNPLYSIDQIIGDSAAMQKIKDQIEKFADTNLPILITGETGTGKEVIANGLHQLSSRYIHNYVKINCAAIPKDLLESELFGYAPGAFSGALKQGKPGKFELADHGTILLDEIGEMSMELQSKLLRVLQEKEVERIGSNKPVKLDIRIIGSTNQNLRKLAESGKFRLDLYYRLNGVEINIPPLRERPEDIAPLCTHFINKINDEYGYAVSGLDEEVMTMFQQYPWKGNIRELEHMIQRACINSPYGKLSVESFDFLPLLTEHTTGFNNSSAADSASDFSLKGQTIEREKELILKALEAAQGNKAKAARLLKIDRTSLYARLKKYNINTGTMP